MDLPPAVSVRPVCDTLEADGRHAGGFAISFNRSPVVRGLQSVRRARQLPIQRQDEITQSETPATLVSGNEYEEATLVTPFPSMCLLTQIAGGLAGRANRVWLVADGRTKGLNYERECLRKNSAMAGLFIFPLATASTMSTSA